MRQVTQNSTLFSHPEFIKNRQSHIVKYMLFFMEGAMTYVDA